MTMQSDQRDQSFVHTASGQTILLTVVLVAVIAIAWLYVW